MPSSSVNEKLKAAAGPTVNSPLHVPPQMNGRLVVFTSKLSPPSAPASSKMMVYVSSPYSERSISYVWLKPLVAQIPPSLMLTI